MRNGNFLNTRVSELRVKQIRVNQSLGVHQFQFMNVKNQVQIDRWLSPWDQKSNLVNTIQPLYGRAFFAYTPGNKV